MASPDAENPEQLAQPEEVNNEVEVMKEKAGCRCCPRTRQGWLICGCSTCVCVLGVLILIVAIVVGNMGGNGITELPSETRVDTQEGVDPTNAMRITWLPGCGEGNKTDEEIDACGGSCFNSSFISQIESFYASNGFRMVNFSSRAGPEGQDVVQIQAWWIPPAPGINLGAGTPPRVVVSHGTNQNQNKFETQIAGFLLASAGFGVLLPSLRDHGYSGSSSHGLFSWGWDYPYDILGAWDYAKEDPHGILGGPTDQVGVMGFSMGGFTAMNAFGMEPAIPAVWADAPVFSVKDILLQEMRAQGGPLGDLGIEFAWRFANSEVELHYNHPAGVLPNGPDVNRKVYIVQNSEDETVPTSQQDKLIELLEAYPQKYTLSGYWLTSAVCNEDKHRILHLMFPSKYRERLCLFWTDVFGLSQDRCTDGSLVKIAGR
mmetsp:Transcript_149266/g.388237  ORF Transcript_149266/g.388237 Transcript_149266/m.388237 type:complete len:431 (+) Transcript_149266:61-1353(+)